MANNFCKQIGANNTHLTNPHGLPDDDHYTTAYDLAVITAYALRNNSFAQAAACKSKTVTISDAKVTLNNHNKLLKMYEGVIGVKTGFTKRSGRCLVSAAKRENTTLIAVTLNDKNDWQDHISMLDYGFAQTANTVIVPKCNKFLPLLSSTETSVELEFQSLDIGLLKGEDITYEISLPPVVYAPIEKGDVLGYTSFFANGRLIATRKIYSKYSYNLEISKTNLFDKLANMYLYLISSI